MKDYETAQKVWEKVIDRARAARPARADAMFNLAILKSDFLEDVPAPRRCWSSTCRTPRGTTPSAQAAEEKRKELGL